MTGLTGVRSSALTEIHPIPAPLPAPALRVVGRPLPAYRYLPGHGPHPFRHPDGHLYTDGSAPEEVEWVDGPWQEDTEWLWGLDLFDHRYYWESHEVLEAIWHHVPRQTPLWWMLKGLIQASAFTLKQHMGQERAADRLLGRSTGLLMQASEQLGAVHRGVHMPMLCERLRAFHVGGPWPKIAS